MLFALLVMAAVVIRQNIIGVHIGKDLTERRRNMKEKVAVRLPVPRDVQFRSWALELGDETKLSRG